MSGQTTNEKQEARVEALVEALATAYYEWEGLELLPVEPTMDDLAGEWNAIRRLKRALGRYEKFLESVVAVDREA